MPCVLQVRCIYSENLGKLTGTVFSLVELALPLGVSFYLFQSAGYLIDVYRGEEAEKNLIDYAAFTIAFPQLTMGPILRCREWRGALKERTITREDVFSGFELFVVGLCFKVLLADQLAPLWARLSASVTNICRRARMARRGELQFAALFRLFRLFAHGDGSGADARSPRAAQL